jgi:large subunit ribosomal protein LP0
VTERKDSIATFHRGLSAFVRSFTADAHEVESRAEAESTVFAVDETLTLIANHPSTHRNSLGTSCLEISIGTQRPIGRHLAVSLTNTRTSVSVVLVFVCPLRPHPSTQLIVTRLSHKKWVLLVLRRRYTSKNSNFSLSNTVSSLFICFRDPTNSSFQLASIFIVNVDNVGSNQMHQIRVALRGRGVVLMGKNTMVRRALRTMIGEYPQLERLLVAVRGNVGFVFTSGDLSEIRDIITANKVAAPARAGALAPKDVKVPAGNTGMEPGKTSFFQALGIPTKIARGTIEIVADVQVVTAGTRVGPSEATLLNMLNISPFTYGMTVVQIYDQGNMFTPDVLDISTDELINRFLTGIKTVAAISLALNYPTIASVTHSLVNAYKNLIAIALVTDYTFDGAEKVVYSFARP